MDQLHIKVKLIGLLVANRSHRSKAKGDLSKTPVVPQEKFFQHMRAFIINKKHLLKKTRSMRKG